jgi:NAD(P)-dependent dehydrogenase (short-subunit alcohol dehydrogenase family)
VTRAAYDFDGTVVIVTGGSSGMGRAIALRFAAAGATVIVADIEREPRDVGADTPTDERIREEGGQSEYVETDVSDPDGIESVVEVARADGGVDVMVNNAGLFVGGPIEEITESGFDRIFGVNAKGVAFGTRAAARDMRERDAGGSIINTASISSEFAQREQFLYDATKGAIRMLTRTAALELAPEIRVNAIAPGAVATEFLDGLTEQQRELAAEGGHIKEIPMERAGEPEDVAGPALFLASDDAAYVTGELLYVDGGWHTF